MSERIYAAIDLKSFYASVECVERGLDPLNTNLVVADEKRTEKTICLAVSPSLKSYGIGGRARLFEVVQRVREINYTRQRMAPEGHFSGESYFDSELKSNPALSLSYIAAPPRMKYYMDYSTKIYKIYLRYIAPEDIHVYSIDEVFMDITDYLKTYHSTPRQLIGKIIREVLNETGITATAGIGTNMYLAKIAMDIMAKRIPADENGVRIAELDEMSYRRELWTHRPLTDFWRVGAGYAKKLEANGLYTMGDIARCSLGRPNELRIENMLYKLFGVNAELLIDHAWGWEPCTIADVKAYRPETNSISSGQVLQSPYEYEKAKLIIKEMADSLSLDLVDKGLVADQLVITIGYDKDNLTDPEISGNYRGEVVVDHYGRKIPKHSHGTVNIGRHTSSSKQIGAAAAELFERIADERLLVRRLNITANHVIPEERAAENEGFEQLDLFSDPVQSEKRREQEEKQLRRERNMQQAILNMKKKYGKNAVLRGMDLREGATAIMRNGQIGGHSG
ncbi:MAG: DNA methylase [Oscillospiraceae bacterium]|nr:DNA methylase [Oscillospiraceae bacterium]